jgi:hypothetical protein
VLEVLFGDTNKISYIEGKKRKKMKYVFRGHIVFEYIPNEKKRERGRVEQHNIEGGPIAAFNFCGFIDEDYKLLGEFFNTVYRHTQGEEVELKDIEVN